MVFEMGGREGPAQHSRGAVFGEFGRGPDVSVAGVASGRPPFGWLLVGGRCGVVVFVVVCLCLGARARPARFARSFRFSPASRLVSLLFL